MGARSTCFQSEVSVCDASVARFVVCVLTTTTVLSSQSFSAPPVLSDQTAQVGFGVSHATTYTGPDMEFMGGGGAAGDFDNDGDLDLFLIGGSAGVDKLYLNDGMGHFIDVGIFAGIARTHQGTGVAVGDYDNDGDLDIYVTSLGPPVTRQPGRNVLYRNDGAVNGIPTFTDVTNIAGVSTTSTSVGETFSASFGDYDLDGDLDLAVAGWLGGSRLYRNNGDGTFTNVTTTALSDTNMSVIRGFAPRFVDIDGDRYPELLFVADFYTSQYFVNNQDGTFTNQTVSSGTGLDSNGMGNTFGDYNNDGVLDWYVSSRINHEQTTGSGNMLYMGGPNAHVFEESSLTRGCNYGYWGWGVVSVDFNHDGALDLFETNGFNGSFESDPSILFVNDGTGHFVDMTTQSGINDAGQGRGLINGDFDRDGDQDLIVLNLRQTPVYYRNDLSGSDINAITLDFDTSSVDGLAPNGFGTRVWIDSASHNQLRYLDGGTNYLSQSELSVHAGIGSDTSASITILWANGVTEVFPSVAPGRYTIKALSCAGDLTGDGILNFFDISRFLTMFTQRHPQGDLNHDGIYNFFDVSTFLGSFSAGCP